MLEKLEAAKAAFPVRLSLLSLTGSFWVLWAFLLPGPHWALPGLNRRPYLTLLDLTCYWA